MHNKIKVFVYLKKANLKIKKTLIHERTVKHDTY